MRAVFEISTDHCFSSGPVRELKNTMFLCLTRELPHGFPLKLKQSWMSDSHIEPQSLGCKAHVVVEISTDYYFGGGPHLNAKKKVHSSLQSQKKPFEATSHESQRQ